MSRPPRTPEERRAQEQGEKAFREKMRKRKRKQEQERRRKKQSRKLAQGPGKR